MGPSGAGKTSLLNALAGDVRSNGHKVKMADISRVSATAHPQVMASPQALARNGRTVVCSIDQPRSSIYTMIDCP